MARSQVGKLSIMSVYFYPFTYYVGQFVFVCLPSRPLITFYSLADIPLLVYQSPVESATLEDLFQVQCDHQ